MDKNVLAKIVKKYNKTKLHNWAKLKYIDTEFQKQADMIENYLNIANISDTSSHEFQAIQKRYNFEPHYYLITKMLSEFSKQKPDYKTIDQYAALFKNMYVKIDYDNTNFLFDSDDLKFNAMKLSNVVPEVKLLIPEIETDDRMGKCHPYSVMLAMFFDENRFMNDATIELATDKIYQLSNKSKYLHSWVEIDSGNNSVVLDATKNIIIEKDAYYEINHVTNPEKVNSKQLLLDYPMLQKLTKYDDYLANVYYENAENGRMIYDMLVKKGEIIEKQPE